MKTKTLLISTALLAAVGVGSYFTVPKIKSIATNMKELVYNTELQLEVDSNSEDIDKLYQRSGSNEDIISNIEARLDSLEDTNKELKESYQKIEQLEGVLQEKYQENCLRLGNLGMVCLGEDSDQQSENYLENNQSSSQGEFYHELSSSLALLNQEDLVYLSKESLNLLETENYDSVIRENDANHWKETMERNFGLNLCNMYDETIEDNNLEECTDVLGSSWLQDSVYLPLTSGFNTLFRRTESGK